MNRIASSCLCALGCILFSITVASSQEKVVATPRDSAVSPTVAPASRTPHLPDKPDKYCVRAKEYYLDDKINDAERLLARSLKDNPGNKYALALQVKIAKLKDRMQYARSNMVNEYYCSAESLFRKGFFLDAMLDIKRGLALDPGSKESKILFLEISKHIEKIVDEMNENDRQVFKKAIHAFLDQDYGAAENYLRKIQNDIPEIGNYISIVINHVSDSANEKRSNEYYAEAFDELSMGRFLKAQHGLYMALEMNRNNFDARLLLEKIDLELADNQVH